MTVSTVVTDLRRLRTVTYISGLQRAMEFVRLWTDSTRSFVEGALD